MHYSCVTNIDNLTGQNRGCKQALHLGELHEQHAKGDTSAKGVIVKVLREDEIRVKMTARYHFLGRRLSRIQGLSKCRERLCCTKSLQQESVNTTNTTPQP